MKRRLLVVWIVLFFVSIASAECNMETVDKSVSPQFYQECECEDEMTVDYLFTVTCCEGYDGPFEFSKVVERDLDTGMFPSEASGSLSISCSCEGCPRHEAVCKVKLEPNADASSGSAPGGGGAGRS